MESTKIYIDNFSFVIYDSVNMDACIENSGNEFETADAAFTEIRTAVGRFFIDISDYFSNGEELCLGL